MDKSTPRVSGEAVSELLNGAGDFLRSERVLRGLTEEQAISKLPGAPYSIAQIAAHIKYWQIAKLAFVKRESYPQISTNEESFPEIQPGGWSSLVLEIVSGVERVREHALAHSDEPVLERPGVTVGFSLARCAAHTGYHLGQIVTLRQLMGLWKPEPDDDDEDDYF